jgi:hypothetical protein
MSFWDPLHSRTTQLLQPFYTQRRGCHIAVREHDHVQFRSLETCARICYHRCDATLYFDTYKAVTSDSVHFDLSPWPQSMHMRIVLEQNACISTLPPATDILQQSDNSTDTRIQYYANHFARESRCAGMGDAAKGPAKNCIACNVSMNHAHKTISAP